MTTKLITKPKTNPNKAIPNVGMARIAHNRKNATTPFPPDFKRQFKHKSALKFKVN